MTCPPEKEVMMTLKYLTLIPATAAVLLLSGCIHGEPERQFSLTVDTVGTVSCKKGKVEAPITAFANALKTLSDSISTLNGDSQKSRYAEQYKLLKNGFEICAQILDAKVDGSVSSS